MPTSVYSSQGRKSEQLFHEDLIIESLSFYGNDFFYIPRSLVAKDEILGEDRLSQFKNAYPIEAYLENVDGFEGQGAFIQKFGLMIEQSATIVIARRRWQQLIEKLQATIIPERPCEGDLLYFPLTDALFEIKFVKHQDPFYQLNNLYVYKLQIELFQYASEHINTGYDAIDVFEQIKSYDTSVGQSGAVVDVVLSDYGQGYASAPTIQFDTPWTANTVVKARDELTYDNKHWVVLSDGTTGTTPPSHTSGSAANGTSMLMYNGICAQAIAKLGFDLEMDAVTLIELIDGGTGYDRPPVVTFVGGNGTGAEATAIIQTSDSQNSYGDNNKFREESIDLIFNEKNPFGDFNV
jgi:hypothetical protein